MMRTGTRMMSGNAKRARIVKVTSGGRITIPAEFRQALDLPDHALLCMTLEEGEIRLRFIHVAGVDEDSDWLDVLYSAYAPIRAEILARGYSEAEIDADIDRAIAEVRAEHLATPA